MEKTINNKIYTPKRGPSDIYDKKNVFVTKRIRAFLNNNVGLI